MCREGEHSMSQILKTRCVICKIEFEKTQNRQNTCSPACKRARHLQMNKKRYRNVVKEAQLEKAKDLLIQNGYSVIPFDKTGYRIILEPMESMGI